MGIQNKSEAEEFSLGFLTHFEIIPDDAMGLGRSD